MTALDNAIRVSESLSLCRPLNSCFTLYINNAKSHTKKKIKIRLIGKIQ